MVKGWKRLMASALTAAMIVPTVLSGAGTMDAKAAPVDNQGEVAAIDLSESNTAAPAAWGVLPDSNQYNYQKEELAGFCHFGMNTFTGSEWGNGKESESLFNLKNEFDAETLVSGLYNAGFKKLIVTAKHHDGFCIWPSAYTTHDTETSGYKGDVLAEISAACTKYGLDMGLYLSPWDENAPSYGYYDSEGNALCDSSGNPKNNMTWEQVYAKDANDYNEYYKNQLQEILGNPKYGRDGHFTEVWMDGAKGGGADAQSYNFDLWFNTIQKNEGKEAGFDADCMLFGAESHTTVRWIGNESGFANEETWSKSNVDKEKNTINSNTKGEYTVGFADGNQWTVPECDARITSGWFWGASKSTPKTLSDLSTMYFNSVGHNGTLLLNVPPNNQGTVDKAILDRLAEFGDNIKETFGRNLAQAEGVTISASAVRGNDVKFSPENTVDNDDNTYWTMDDAQNTGSFTIDLGTVKTFDVVSIEEAIQLGQRISGFKVEYQNKGGEWKQFAQGTTIGAKRLCRSSAVKADKVRISITSSHAVPLISEVGLFKASEGFELGQAVPDGLDNIDITDKDPSDGKGFTYTGWTQETGTQYTNNTNMWANAGSEFSVKFTGTKAWIIGTKDPNHGTADVYIDGKSAGTIDTNSAARAVGQKIFESADLSDGEHTLRLVVKSKAIGVECALALNNGGAGMLEIENPAYSVPEDTVNNFKVKRIGGSKGEITVLFQDNPGSAVQSDYLPTEGLKLTFADGVTEQTGSVTTKRQPLTTGDVFFTLELVEPTGGAVIGFNGKSKITIIDSDRMKKEDIVKLIEQVDTLLSAHYTAESWTVLQNAKKAAQATVDKAEPSQTEINKSYSDLNNAKGALVKRGVYTAEDPFAFPSKRAETKLLEAEYLQLDGSGAQPGKEVRVENVDWASNGQSINWFENGNKIILHYTAARAGTYTVNAAYRSGRIEGAGKPNAFNWSGEKITSGSKEVYGENNATTTHTVAFDIEVKEAGAGTFILTADAKAGPMIDKFEIVPKDIGIKTYKITASAGIGGSISDAGETTVDEETSKTYTITASKGYAVKDVLVNGESVGAVTSYTFENISADNTIDVQFTFANYTAENPAVLPADGTVKAIEAEHFELYPVNTDKYVRISDNNGASNKKEINWFEPGNVIKLPYVVEKAGTYLFKATYRSGRISGGTPNSFVWSGTAIESGHQDVFGEENATTYHTVELPIQINEAGAGELVLTADAKAGPVIDKFEVMYQDRSVSGVTLNKSTATLDKTGGTVQLTAAVTPENAANKNVFWTSSKPEVATVTSTGLVTAVSNGTTTITVTSEDGNKKAACEVTVNAPVVIPVTGVTLNKTEAVLEGAAQTVQLTATVAPANATNKKVKWTSSNQAAATVDANGLVTAKTKGTTAITATAEDGGFMAISIITVTMNQNVKVTSVNLDKNAAVLTGIGDGVLLNAQVLPANATNKSVAWSTSNPGAATVNELGFVTSVGAGSADITVTTKDGNFTAVCSVTVTIPSETIPAAGLTLTPNSVSITESNGQIQLVPSVTPANATNRKVNYVSSNPSVATVDATGLVTAVSNGSTVITGTVDGTQISAECMVTVSISDEEIPVTSVSLDKSYEELINVGDTVQLNASVMPENASNKNITWKTTEPEVATVDANGMVTAVSQGITYITAVWADGLCMDICFVKVGVPEIKVSGVLMDRKASLLEHKGETVQLYSVVTPSNATNKNVTWASSDEAVASVSANGVVTANKSGTAVITVKTADGEFTDICEVTVKLPEEAVKVTGIQLNRTARTFKIKGGTYQLKAAVVPEKATDKTVKWASTNNTVVKVDANGLVTAVGNGRAIVYAVTADGGKMAQFVATVRYPNTRIKKPGQITGVTTKTYTKNSITLKWNQRSDADYYRVYRYDYNKSAYVFVNSTYSTSMTVSGLDYATKYKFKVAGVNGAGRGFLSSTYGTATKSSTVKLLSVKQSGTNSVTLNFSSVRRTGTYVYLTGSDGTLKRVGGTSKTSYTIKNLNPGTTYKFRVRSYVKNTNKTAYGNLSNTLTFQVK